MKWLIIFITFFTFAKIISFQTHERRTESLSWESICKRRLGIPVPLIEAMSKTYLSCMGEKVAVKPFCDKKFVDHPRYLHGQVNIKNKTVDCIFAKKVVIDYKCKNCEKPKKFCKRLRDLLTKNLSVEKALIESEKIKCIMSAAL